MIDLTSTAQLWISNDEKLSSYLIDFLHEADFNISDIHTKSSPKTLSNAFVAQYHARLQRFGYSPDITKELIKRRSNEYKTTLAHSVENEDGNKTYLLSLDEGEESTGTVRTLGIEAHIYTALQYNFFFSIDEIETSLHPKLLEKILFDFLKQENSRSQLIVTTHNDGLLDLTDDLIRKDSVWFTEKQKNGSTELYKLTDFRGVNRLSSIREAYRNKRFGATMNN